MKYSTRDYEGFRNDMILLLQDKMPEYTDKTSTDAGIVIIELLAYALDLLSYYNDVVANESLLPLAKERGSVIEHTKAFGYKIPGSTPSKVYQVFEIVPQVTDYVIPKGYKIKTSSSSSEESIYFETDADLIIPAGKTGIETSDGEYIYKVSATQGYTVISDVLGSSNGTQNQTFLLNFSPVIESSIVIHVNEGTGFLTWTNVKNFIDSTQYDGHYTVEIDENDKAKIIFGDGSAGKIPSIYQNGIISTYRVGGGIIGNVGSFTINEVVETRAEIKKTFNPEIPYELGKEKESIDVAKVKAIAQISSLWRAVTTKDFESLALTNLKVLKAKAIEDLVNKSVDLYLLPTDTDTLTQDDLTKAQNFFSERKLLGVTVNLHSPVYIGLNPLLTVKIDSSYKVVQVKADIDNVMRNEIFAKGNYDFGQTFTPYDLISKLMSVAGVKSVYVYVDDNGTPVPIQDVDVNDNEIITLSELFNVDTSVTIVGV